MKKILSIVTCIAISMSIFTGCGSSNTAATSQNSSTSQSSSSSQGSSTSTSTTNGTDGSTQTRKSPDLAGEVSSINGSEVILKIIELPTMNQDKNGKPQGGQDNNQGAPADGQKPSGSQSSGQDITKPKMQPKYTGETKTITISDGISITTFNRDSKDTTGKPTEKSLTVKDIKVGNRLNIWYTDSNKTSISKINVLDSNPN